MLALLASDSLILRLVFTIITNLEKYLYQKRHKYPIPNEIHHLIIGLMTKSNCSVAPQQGLSENSGNVYTANSWPKKY
jgi:hypothetical protein